MNLEQNVQLTDLVHRYAAHVDDRRPAEVAALFTEDGVLLSPDPPEVLDPVVEHVGRAAIAQAMSQLPRTFHAIVGVVLDVASDGQTATGRIACVAHHVLAPDKDLVWHVRYADEYRRTSEGWRIARRALSIDLIETRPLKRSRPS